MDTPAKQNVKAFGYIRVSGKGQVDGDGFTRQRTAIAEYAAANGFQIVQWFEEAGVSGTLESREALDAMLVALMSNGVRTVIVEKLDRLARDLRVQENLIHQYFAPVTGKFSLISTAEPDLGSDDPARVFIRQIFGAVAQLDKSSIVLKLRAARQRTRIATGRCEGRKRFGQHPDRPQEVAILNKIRELHAAGSNYEQIARSLNSDGAKTRGGGVWYPATVRGIVRQS